MERDLRWFDNETFRDLCISNHLEAFINGDGQLILSGSKLPSPEVQKKFKALIPPEQPTMFTEGMSVAKMAILKVYLLAYGVSKVLFQHTSQGHVNFRAYTEDKSQATQPGSPLWDDVAAGLRSDPYVKTFKIYVNDKLYRDSEGYSEPDEPYEGSPEDREPVREKASPKIAVKDDRFAYEREYLPPDVGTDVQILLETSEDSQAFIDRI